MKHIRTLPYKQPAQSSAKVAAKILKLSDRYQNRFGRSLDIKIKSLVVTCRRIGFRVYDGGAKKEKRQ